MDSAQGPNLQNVYGALAGTAPATFDPKALYHHPLPPLAIAHDMGLIWTEDNLFQYLAGPQRFLEKKTGMSFDVPLFYMAFFIGDPVERRNVIAYLKAIKGRPECD
jgi:cytochrome c